MSPSETGRVLQQVARAIGRAHEAGIVHRDLKPDNIYLVRNDDDEIAKVLDFGIAKSNAHGAGAAVGGGTRTGAVLGTPYYMSPEQAEGAKTLDGRADIWAMGVIAFECLLGSRPFDEETLGSLLLAICARPIPIPSQRGPVPPGFDEWFARACARGVAERYAAARDAAADLRQICEATLGTSGNYGPPSHAPGALGSQTPAPRFGSGNLGVVTPNTGAVSGQSVPGFASTQVEAPVDLPKKSGGGLALVLAAVGILAVGGGVLAWTRLSGSPSAAASASANATPSAPLIASAPAHVEPSIIPAPLASIVTPNAEPAAAEAVTTAKAGAAGHPGAGARPHASPAAHPLPPPAARAPVTAPPAAPAAPAPAPAKPADNRVNLGI